MREAFREAGAQMKRIPKQLTINGQKWRVEKLPLRHLNLDGHCHMRKRLIRIDSELPRAEQEETFLHELMHACFGEPFPIRLEEKFIRRLSPRLYEVLTNTGWMK